MINEIVSGISNALYEEFGAEYKIYAEDLEQGLEEPCFFVYVLKPEQVKLLGERYFLIVPVDVHFMPASEEKQQEINAVAMRLMLALKRITLLNGDLLNGLDLSSETVDNVLHFFVTYKPTIFHKAAAEENMETLILENRVKESD